MEVSHLITEDALTVKVVGQITGADEKSFGDEVEMILKHHHKKVELDLTHVPSMNSSAIGKLILLQKMLNQKRRELLIRGIHESLYNAFYSIHIDKMVKIKRS